MRARAAARAAVQRVRHVVGHRRRSHDGPRCHRVGNLRRSRRSVPHGRAGRGRARKRGCRVPGRRRQHPSEPDAGLPGAAEGHGSQTDHRASEPGSGVSEPAVRHPRSAGAPRGTFRSDQRVRIAGHAGTGARHRDLLLDSGQYSSPGDGDPERSAGVSPHDGRDHRSRDGGNGGGRRIGRRQPLHVPTVALGWIEAGDALRRQDGTRRVHPDGREERHER